MTTEQEYLIKLIKAAATQTVPPVPPVGLDMQVLIKLASASQFDNIIYERFKLLGIYDESYPLMHTLKQRYGRAVLRDALQDMELTEIAERFAAEKIPYIPLKGSTVKKYYPQHDIRRSGDIDILIHPEDLDKADEILRDLGYTCDKRGRDVHDVYEQDKTHIEIHISLTDKKDNAYEFCQKVWDNSVAKENYLYEMNPEFMYVYLIVHLRRHLLHMGGGGIKLILDFWILNRSFEFNEQKLGSFIHEARLENLQRYAEGLMYKWFYDKKTTDEHILMLEQLLLNSDGHGNYGTYVNMTLARGNKGSFMLAKMKNFIHLMCPPLKDMQAKYEILKKHPILLPFSWVKRVFDARDEHVKAIANSVNSLKKDEAQALAEFCDNVEE